MPTKKNVKKTEKSKQEGPTKTEVLKWAGDLYDRKIDGMLIICKSTKVENGISIEGKNIVNNMHKLAVIKIVTEGLHLSIEDLVMGKMMD